MASADLSPVSPDEALTAFRPTLGRAGVALAVSGGADSLSLLHLWADARAGCADLPPAVVFTVDHRLRPEAAAEAAFVARIAAARGLEHRILAWDGPKPAGNLQAAARAARRRLLAEAAHAHGLDTLLLAHHADDQAETFLLRLARGSGVRGLAAMARLRFDGDLMVLRPFLDWPKARLAASLEARGATWIEDPSNRDVRFDRARMRAAMPTLAALGLDRDRLVATARAMARAEATLAGEVAALAGAAAEVHPAGFFRIDAGLLLSADEEIRLRLLARAIATLGGSDWGPRLSALAALDADLGAGGDAPIVRTLGGVRIERRRGRIWLAPEAGRTAAVRLDPGGSVRRGGRSFALPPTARAGVVVAPLGTAGRLAAAGEGRDADPFGRPAPSAGLLEGLVGFFDVDGRPIGSPGLRVVGAAAEVVVGPIDPGWAIR